MANLCFSFLSHLRSFINTFFLTQNALLRKTFRSILPHSCPRDGPASAGRERLVRWVHARQMLLGSTCRLWCFGIGANCQSVLYIYQARRFSVPFADTIHLRIHSGALSARFLTLPLPLVGKLPRVATRVPQRKISGSCARTTIRTATTFFRVTEQ